VWEMLAAVVRNESFLPEVFRALEQRRDAVLQAAAGRFLVAAAPGTRTRGGAGKAERWAKLRVGFGPWRPRTLFLRDWRLLFRECAAQSQKLLHYAVHDTELLLQDSRVFPLSTSRFSWSS
jgi:hypothetical protein